MNPFTQPEGSCRWYGLCFQPAAGIVKVPTRGNVPTCRLCADRFDLPLEPNSEPDHDTQN